MGSSLRPHWILAELNVPYETVSLDMRAGEHKQPAYLAINPAGQVPAMQMDDFALSESAVIVRYLADKYKWELNGATPEVRAKGMQWEHWTLLNVQKHMTTLASPSWTGVSNPEAETKAKEELAKVLPILDQYLADNQYLAGKEFTTADINAAVTFTYAMLAKFDLTPYVHISRWLNEMMARPSFAQARGEKSA